MRWENIIIKIKMSMIISGKNISNNDDAGGANAEYIFEPTNQ